MVKLVFTLFLLATYIVHGDATGRIIATLIRDNVAGQPVIHETQKWPFHPDDGIKRNADFEAVHGHRSYNLIERLGLGTDGKQEERKYQQFVRDLGVPTTSYYNQNRGF